MKFYDNNLTKPDKRFRLLCFKTTCDSSVISYYDCLNILRLTITVNVVKRTACVNALEITFVKQKLALGSPENHIQRKPLDVRDAKLISFLPKYSLEVQQILISHTPFIHNSTFSSFIQSLGNRFDNHPSALS